MQLKLGVRNVNGIAVVDAAGRIVFGDESASLRETVKRNWSLKINASF